MGNFSLVDKLVLQLNGEKAWFFHGDVFDASIQNAIRGNPIQSCVAGARTVDINQRRLGVSLTCHPLRPNPLHAPPAAPPACHCHRPCLWMRGRWWCPLDSDGCGFERAPQPAHAPLAPLCLCGNILLTLPFCTCCHSPDVNTVNFPLILLIYFFSKIHYIFC